MTFITQEKGFISIMQIVSKPLVWRQKWVAHVRLLVLRSRKVGKYFVYFTAKYAVPHQIKTQNACVKIFPVQRSTRLEQVICGLKRL